GRDRGGSGRAQRGDGHRIHDGEGLARDRFAQDHDTLYGRQPVPRAVVREIGIGLGREVGLAEGEQRGLDVETAVLGVQAEYSRRRRLAQRVLAEGVLDGADALVGRQETLDVAARQEQRAGSGTRASAGSAGWKSSVRCKCALHNSLLVLEARLSSI